MAKKRTFFERVFVLKENHPRRAVTSPHHFSLKDWHVVLLETRLSLRDKKIPTMAAGSAFFAVLAFFPLLAALIAIVAYNVDAQQLQAGFGAIEQYFPIDLTALVGSQIQGALSYDQRNIAIAIIAVLLALYSATRAMYILISSLNTVYEQPEVRSGLKLLGISFLMAIGAIIMTAIVIGLVFIDEDSLRTAGIPLYLAVSLPVLRWVILAVMIAASLALFYRIGPSNHSPHWQWVSWGAAISSVLWLVGTTLFFLYAKYISVYNNIYNVFGSVIVLLVWLNLSASIILVGAEINHRLEQRTTRRTAD